MSMLDEVRRYSKKDVLRYTSNKVEHHISNSIPSAKQYIFDTAASTHMANFIQDCGDLVLKNEQFAIPQFPKVYYEFDIDAFLKTLNRPQSGYDDRTRDGTVGYFVADNVIYVLCRGLDLKQKPTLLHFGYSIGKTHMHRMIQQPLLSRRRKAQFFLGSTMEDATISQFQDIAEKYEILNLAKEQSAADDDYLLVNTILKNATGDIRNLITMILFLYQSKDVTTIQEFGPSSRILKGKRTTYLSYGTVKINLRDTKAIRRKFHISGSHASPRAHWVEPYYRTIPKTKCDHDFICETEEKRWRCQKCKAVRVRIEQYHRGDATKGYKLKTYEVTAQ